MIPIKPSWLSLALVVLLTGHQVQNTESFSASTCHANRNHLRPMLHAKGPIHLSSPPHNHELFSFALYSTNTDQDTHDSDPNGVPSSEVNGERNRRKRGVVESKDASAHKGASKLLQDLQRNKRKTILAAFLLAVCALGFSRRLALLQVLASIDLSGIQQGLQNSLNRLSNAGTAGLVLYASLFCLWTMTIGITTPVETAAGFAFGAKRSIVANAFGKIVGAMLAFFLGRYMFLDVVRHKVKDNEILQLVEESITENPLLVAVMVRFSPLPEPVKNLGMSVLEVKSRYYILSVLLHGLPFTCLWSCMGAETAKMVTLGTEASKTLKILVSGSTWFGAILSPSLIGWWLNSLRAKRAKRLAQSSTTAPET